MKKAFAIFFCLIILCVVLADCRAADEINVQNGAIIVLGGKSWAAFPGWTGTVNWAVGDLNADGTREIVAAPGAGGGPIIRVFDFNGRLLGQFNAYDPRFRGGVNLAVGDVNSDGRDEIITGAGPGGGPHVRVFNQYGQVISQWFAFSKWLKSGVLVSIEQGEVKTSEQNLNTGFEMPVPFHRQEHSLSCEVASLKSALAYMGVEVSESKLISLQPQSYPREYKDGVWGDPAKGYVGDIDGSQPLMTGYGIYWEPIAQIANKFRRASSFKNVSWATVADYLIHDNPVIVWGNLRDNPRTLIWNTAEGASVLGFMGEHTYAVLGWQGNQANPDRVILLDPIRGRLIMSFESFLNNWSFLGNSGVVIY